mgnify:CR=1 FL=1
MGKRPISGHTFTSQQRRSWPAAEEGERRRPREFTAPWVEIDGIRVVVKGSPRARIRTQLATAPKRTAVPTAGAGGEAVSVLPGPGEPAAPPGPGLKASRQHRVFQCAVDAWIASGTGSWWRVEVVDYPADTQASRRARRNAYNRLHNAWTREVERRVKYDGLTGDYTARVVTQGIATYWTWGPAGDVPADRPGVDDPAADADGDVGGPAAPPA